MASAVDQSNYVGITGIGFGDTGNGRDYLSQGFITSFGNVTHVSFHIADKDGDANVGYKVWIDNCDANSTPTGAVGVGIGGATEITNATLVTAALTRYQLTTPLTGLTPGVRYCLVAAPWNTTTHVWANSYHDWRSGLTNPYTKGRRTHAAADFATWVAPDSGNDDILFEIWGDRPDIPLHANVLRPGIFKPGNAR